MRLIDNPPNPYLSEHHEWLEPPPTAALEYYEERGGSILTENDSPDLPFRWSVNPYRGCQHACAYCYARPYHEFLGFGAGTDFDTRIVVKTNAAELLAKALSSPRWCGESINFSGVTDCYQPVEAVYQLTRRCLEVCRDHRNAASVVTKSFLVVRDAELLAELQSKHGGHTYVSIPFADDATARMIEPHAPSISRRFEALRRLVAAGVRTGVMVAPLIPGLNDRDIDFVLRRAAECGATTAGYVALRLPGSVQAVFLARLREALPLRADRVIARIRDIRGGRMNETRFGARMRGQGVYWQSVRDLFTLACRKYGLNTVCSMASADGCGRPPAPPARIEGPREVQLSLFPA